MVREYSPSPTCKIASDDIIKEMTEYLIKNGADCRIAVNKDELKLQEADIKNTLELNKLITESGHPPAVSPERLRHLGKLLTAINRISESELPKTVNIPD